MRIVSAVLLAATITFTQSPVIDAQQPKKSAAQAAGRIAPDFTRKALDGKAVHLVSYRDKVVLLNFWATWCGPCIAEIPKFSAWQTKYGPQGLQVLGISMDDDRAPVDKFYRKYQLTYPIAMGDEHLGELYGGVLGLPISYLIGRDGKIIERFQGETNLDQLEKKIVTALSAKK